MIHFIFEYGWQWGKPVSKAIADLLKIAFIIGGRPEKIIISHRDADFIVFDGVPRGGYNSINVIRRESGETDDGKRQAADAT